MFDVLKRKQVLKVII